MRNNGAVDVVIVGAPKAGTTTLARWLGSHPDAHAPRAKEVSYFDLHYARGPQWYEAQFAEGGGVARVDATPAYLYSDLALRRLSQDAPDARIIVILREPVSRVWSHYWYNQATGIDPRSILKAIRAELRDPSNTPYNLPVGYLTCSRYLPRLHQLAEIFASDQVLVLLLDDLIAAPQATWDRVCDHAGLKQLPVPNDGAPFNVGHHARSGLLQHALLRAGAGHWPLRLGPRLSRRNLVVGYPPMTGEVAELLIDALDPDTRALGEWLGDLPPQWKNMLREG